MVKKFVWVFIVSILIFLGCTYFVTREVEGGPPNQSAVVGGAHRHEAVRPGGIPRAGTPNRSPTASGSSGGTSAVTVIQALSGLIAALSGLLAAINAFRRKSTAP
jgi:hypothetical protein